MGSRGKDTAAGLGGCEIYQIRVEVCEPLSPGLSFPLREQCRYPLPQGAVLYWIIFQIPSCYISWRYDDLEWVEPLFPNSWDILNGKTQQVSSKVSGEVDTECGRELHLATSLSMLMAFGSGKGVHWNVLTKVQSKSSGRIPTAARTLFLYTCPSFSGLIIYFLIRFITINQREFLSISHLSYRRGRTTKCKHNVDGKYFFPFTVNNFNWMS